MARINLTIPDQLYERLERLRDRVNVSKVCAIALARELDMLENATSTVVDSKVQRLVQRILRQREIHNRWYLRGKQDGEVWAVDRASVEELRLMDKEWDDESVADLDSLDEFGSDSDEYPTLNAAELLDRWAKSDRKDGIAPDCTDADKKAYVLGWYHSARDLWRSAKSELE